MNTTRLLTVCMAARMKALFKNCIFRAGTAGTTATAGTAGSGGSVVPVVPPPPKE